VTSANPTTSIRLACSARDSGTSRAVSASAAAPTGRVDQEDRAPAAAGDVGVDEQAADELTSHRGGAHHHAVHVIARTRRGPVYSTPSIESTLALIMAAPTPRANLAPTSMRASGTSPQAAETSTNSGIPIANARRRRSDRPAGRR
jgi:hypothetical protein